MSIWESLYWKIKAERAKYLYDIAQKEAFKLSFAVVVVEFILVIGYYQAQNRGLLSFLEPKVMTIQVYAKEIKPLEVKNEAPEGKQESKIAEQLAEIIHIKESSKGKAKKGLNATCKAKGLSNEYGYNPPKCYKDNEAVKGIVINWIKDKQAQGLSDNELLCLYNTGIISDTCDYIN
jgi:hypothetical protein